MKICVKTLVWDVNQPPTAVVKVVGSLLTTDDASSVKLF